MRAFGSLVLLVLAACFGCKPPAPVAAPAAADGPQVSAETATSANPATTANLPANGNAPATTSSAPSAAPATNVNSATSAAPPMPVAPALTPTQEREALNRLKDIVIAMHTYHDVFREFPPSKRQKDIWGPDGKPHLSWRVMLLPYLDQPNLFKQFHLNEPWDSEHNLKLLDEMPEVYKTGDDPQKTSVVAVYGPGAAMDENGKGSEMRKIKDGTSNTILFVKAGPDKAVLWTKPEDVPLVPTDPLSALGNVGDTLAVALGDGAVKRLSTTIPPDKLAALFTINGEEYVKLSDFEVRR